MVNALAKYFGLWLVVTLAVGFLASLSVSGSESLNAQIVERYEQNLAEQNGDGLTEEQIQENIVALDQFLEREAERAEGSLLNWYAIAMIIPLLFGIAFVAQAAIEAEKASTPDEFKALRPSWTKLIVIMLILIIILGALAHFTELFGLWPTKLQPALAWGWPAGLIILSALIYAGGTKLATPDIMQPSLPL